MAGIWNKLSQGQQLYMRKQQNAMAMEKYNRAVERDEQMRNILSEAVTPSRAAMPSAPAEGPLPIGEAPLPDYPAQEFRPARMDMQNALGAMYEGGLGPEAMAMEQKQRQLRGATPSSVNEYRFFEQLPLADKKKFMRLKRAKKYLDIGTGFAPQPQVPDDIPEPTIERGLKPTEQPEYISGKAETIVTSKELGKEKALLANLEASLPNLKNVTNQLSDLGRIATYTKAGQAADATARQLGMPMSEGAIARREYISKVDNEILPLLKQTFGAAFTQKEGETLKATLGDPDASPEEKDAVLKSFIESKIAQIETKRRRVGQPTAPQDVNRQALDWANRNPGDPRAMKILQKLGAQ